MSETLEAFGHLEKISKKILIIGGGNIGYNLAKNIEETLETTRVKIVEKDKQRAEYLASELNDSIIINGDGLDEEVLVEANLDEAETVLALTNDDEDNLMVSVLVEKFAKDKKKTDDKRTMALINKPNYSLLQSSLKIDDLIDPRMTTVSSILKHIHKGTIENAYTISNGEYEVIEAEIIETSELINHRNALYADLEIIYREFSAGNKDPMAIRTFLQWTQEEWQSPHPNYLLLIGDAGYDYRNINGFSNIIVPTIQVQATRSYATDDLLSSIYGNIPELATGRFPAKNNNEVSNFVDKVLKIENEPNLGPWRQNITLIADDASRPEPTHGSISTGKSHTLNSEQLSNLVPPSIYINKLYMLSLIHI